MTQTNSVAHLSWTSLNAPRYFIVLFLVLLSSEQRFVTAVSTRRTNLLFLFCLSRVNAYVCLSTFRPFNCI